MDTSELYLSNSRVARVIQEGWFPMVGDHVGVFTKLGGFVYYGILAWNRRNWVAEKYITGPEPQKELIIRGTQIYNLNSNDYFCLPKQDQLQDICKFHPVVSNLTYCNVMIQKLWDIKKERYDSWEQMWLHVLMAQKNKKIWDGESWEERKCSG